MKIKMLKKQAGSEDGKTVQVFEAGQEYDVVEKLAKIFVNSLKVAEFIQEEILEVTKGIKAAPENKAVNEDTFSRKKVK